jgi:hypothetical protein
MLWRMMIAVALALGPRPSLAAEVPQVANGTNTTQMPISRKEIMSAIANGSAIAHRAINAVDLVESLKASIARRDEKCNNQQALRIENSIINGDIVIRADGSASAEGASEDEETEPKAWVPFPFEIKDSVVNGQVEFDRLAFSCELDLSASTFNDEFIVGHGTFASDAKASDVVFKSGFT